MMTINALTVQFALESLLPVLQLLILKQLQTCRLPRQARRKPRLKLVQVILLFKRDGLIRLNRFKGVWSKADDPLGRKQTILKNIKADDPGPKQTIIGSKQTI